MNRLFAALVLAVPGWAYSSLTVAPGTSGILTVPGVAPFTSMGDYRVEFRIHDWTLPTSGSAAYLSWGSVYSGARYLEITFSSAGKLCAVDWVDTPLGQQSCADVTGHTDVLVRVQRFKAGTADTTAWGVGSFRIEVQDIGGTPLTSYCSTSTIAYPCPITAATGDWSRMAGFVGNSNVRIGYSLAWLKWFSTTVEPGGHYSQEATPADLADFRFEGNLYNQGTGSYNVSIGALSGSTTYAASPSLSPTCVAGPQQVFRAGYPAQADGTGSYALNSDPSLTYLWQELSGPTEIQWDARDTATPTVTGTAFGSYVLQLTVTDRAGQSSTCQVKHGFVATNDKNVVITSQPAVDALLGNLIRYGNQPLAVGRRSAQNRGRLQRRASERLLPAVLAGHAGTGYDCGGRQQHRRNGHGDGLHYAILPGAGKSHGGQNRGGRPGGHDSDLVSEFVAGRIRTALHGRSRFARTILT